MLPQFVHAVALAAAIWSGGNTPPAHLEPGREIPATDKTALIGEQAMVASAHSLASRAGADIMAAGGNFADAALAVQAVLAVVEPESSGPGGGCFILFHDMATDSLYAIDGREELPRQGWPKMFLNDRGKPLSDLMTGGRPVGVPGTIAAMCLLHREFGRLPLDEVIAPAIDLAEGGFPVSPDLARAIHSQARRLRRFDASRALYFHEDDRPYEEGEILRNPELAITLRLWAGDPSGDFFYRGELARAMAEVVENNEFREGPLRVSDLANYRAVFREPLRGSYRGHALAAFPPPTSGGVTLFEILGLMETREALAGDLRDESTLVEHLDRLARASRVAFSDRDRWLGDPDWAPDLPMRDLCGEAWIADRAPLAFAKDADLALAALPGDLEKHTTHFSIVDAEGSMLACTSTIETTFGSAQVVPGYGFLLNNELTDFNWVPDPDTQLPNDVKGGRMPRITALHDPEGEGGKRPRSSMCPVIIYGEDGQPKLAIGSPGGSRIIGTVATAILCLLDFDLGLQEALDFPRLHCRNRPVEIESFGWNRETMVDCMSRRGWEIAPLYRYPLLQGDMHAVRILPDGRREGASDPRHDGAPAGY